MRIGAIAVAVGCLLAVVAESAGGAGTVGTLGLSPRLLAAPGWVVVKPGRSEPNVGADAVVAVTRADAATVLPFDPFVGFTRLSKAGIIVWATTIGRRRPSFHFPRARLPLRLSGFRVDHGWEGQPAANIQQRLRWAAVGGWDLDVRVYFATQHP